MCVCGGGKKREGKCRDLCAQDSVIAFDKQLRLLLYQLYNSVCSVKGFHWSWLHRACGIKGFPDVRGSCQLTVEQPLLSVPEYTFSSVRSALHVQVLRMEHSAEGQCSLNYDGISLQGFTGFPHMLLNRSAIRRRRVRAMRDCAVGGIQS